VLIAVGASNTVTPLSNGTITFAGGTLWANGTLNNVITVQTYASSGIVAYLSSLTLNGNLMGGGTLPQDHGETINLGGNNGSLTGTYRTVDAVTCFTSTSAGSYSSRWDAEDGEFTAATGGGSIYLGALSGTANSVLRNDDLGTTVTYYIGSNLGLSAEFDGVIEDGQGAVKLSKYIDGTLILGGQNTYTGGTEVTGGTLEVKNPAALPGWDDSQTQKVKFYGGTLALRVGGSDPWTAERISTLLGCVGGTTGSLGFDTTDAGSQGYFGFNGAIGRFFGVTKLGDNELILGGDNTYTGGTDVEQGAIVAASDNALGASAGNLTLGVGTSLLVDASLTITGNITGSGTIDCTGSGSGSILSLGGDNSGFGGEMELGPSDTYTRFTSASAGSSQAAWVVPSGGTLASSVSASSKIALGSISGTGTLTNLVSGTTVTFAIGGANQTTTFSGTIEDGDGWVALSKTADGSLKLTGTNTYSGGTVISGGTLVAVAPGTLPGYNASGKLTVHDGGTLALEVGGTGDWSNSLSTLLGYATFYSGSTLALDTGDGNFTCDGVIGGSLSPSHSLSLAKLGTGTLTLTAANGYSGATFVRNGTLILAGGHDRLPTSTVVTLGDAAASTSGVLQLGNSGTASNQTLAGLLNDMDYQYSASNDRVVCGSSGTATLTLDLVAGADDEFDGILGGTGANQNNLALVINGLGTEELSAVNTYNGGTTLTAGVLQVWNTEALGSGSVTTTDGVLRNLDAYRGIPNRTSTTSIPPAWAGSPSTLATTTAVSTTPSPQSPRPAGWPNLATRSSCVRAPIRRAVKAALCIRCKAARPASL
jgi:autotransporter-associated beta strand protein